LIFKQISFDIYDFLKYQKTINIYAGLIQESSSKIIYIPTTILYRELIQNNTIFQVLLKILLKI